MNSELPRGEPSPFQLLKLTHRASRIGSTRNTPMMRIAGAVNAQP